MKTWIISTLVAVVFLVLGAVGGAIGATSSIPGPADQSLNDARDAANSLVAIDGSPRSVEYLRGSRQSVLALNIVLVAQMYDRLSDASQRDAAVELAQRIEQEPPLQLSGNGGIAHDAKAARHCIIDHHAKPADVVKCMLRKQRDYRNDASRPMQAN